MNRQKLACLSFVLSILACLVTTSFAQDPALHTQERNPQISRPPRVPLTGEAAAAFVLERQAATNAASPDQTQIPLGTYVAILQRDVVLGNFPFFAGEVFVTLQAGGKYQLGRHDWIFQSGTYTITGNTIEFVSPYGMDTCSNKGIYTFQVAGNRVSFSPTSTRTTDACAERIVALASGPMLRTDNVAKEWKNIGPTGGRITALYAADGKVFAGGDGAGMFVSSDNGQTWKSTKGSRANSVFAFGSFNGLLFAGGTVGVSPIYVSQDGGDTWEFAITGIGSTVVDFVESGGKFYAATTGNGVWRMGANPYVWEKVGTAGLTNQNVQSLATIGSNLFAATDGGGVFRSGDGGATWTAVNTGITQPRMRTLAVDGTKLYAGSSNGTAAVPNEVFISENNGQSWTKLGNGIGADFPAGFTNATFELVTFSGKIFAAGTSGVLAFDGTKWSQVFGASGGPIISHVTLTASGNTLLAGAWFDGIARSTDGGATWARSNNGLTGRFTNTVHKDSGVLYAGVRDGIFVSNNEGQNWTRGTMPNSTNVYCFHSFDGKVYAGSGLAPSIFTNGAISGGAGVYVTSDLGTTWTRVSTGLPANATVWRIINVGSTLYAALTGGGVYRSTDGGQNWTAANNGLPSLNARDIVAQGTNLFVGLNNLGIFRSADGGQSWTPANNGLPSPITVYNIITVGNTLLAGVSAVPGIYRSENGGQTWTLSANNDLPSFAYVLHAHNGIVYAGPDGGVGILRSLDEGRTWQVFNAGFDTRFALSQGIHGSGNSLYAAGFNGVYVSNIVNRASTVSAASFSANAVVEKSIVTAFGAELANSTQTASSATLPTTLAGTTVRVRDSNGVERPAPLFGVSAGQVNFQIPTGTAVGDALVTITNADQVGAVSQINVKTAAPGIFAANNGTGAAAAVDAITGAGGPFNATQANGQPNVIAVFGTGIGATGTDVDGNLNTSTTARIGSAAATVLYAGRAPGFVGLNQFNIQLPANIPAGTYPLTIVRGLASNTVTITIK